MKCTVQINYKASIVFDVEGEDEGAVLQKARELAEEADANDFSFGEELESQILR
jgi:hypothetical protein